MANYVGFWGRTTELRKEAHFERVDKKGRFFAVWSLYYALRQLAFQQDLCFETGFLACSPSVFRTDRVHACTHCHPEDLAGYADIVDDIPLVPVFSERRKGPTTTGAKTKG